MELMLFETCPEGARIARDSGITSFLVDFEIVDKKVRQKGYDTEIKPGTLSNLRNMAKVDGIRAWCRINRWSPETPQEINSVVEAGAEGILLPMVKSPDEVEAFLRSLDGRCSAGILVETPEGLNHSEEIAKFPLSRVYFGLNDFAICRGTPFIFQAVLDGSVERAREVFGDIRFGFGGMTAIDAGSPVPAHMLMREMARLKCDFTFLRRSYRKDIRCRNSTYTIDCIQGFWKECCERTSDVMAADKQALDNLLMELSYVYKQLI